MQRTSTLSLVMAIIFLNFYLSSGAQDGTLDSSFGTNGAVWDPFVVQATADRSLSPTKTLVQPDGKILQIYQKALYPYPNDSILVSRYLVNGVIDSSFGTLGTVAIPSSKGLHAMKDACLLPGGKFLVAGVDQYTKVPTGFGYMAGGVIKCNADGTLDQSFGTSGKVAINMNGFTILRGLTVQRDGRIILAGSVSNHISLMRLLPDGSPDASFDGDGILVSNFSAAGEDGYDVAEQPNGKLVVAGSVRDSVTGAGSPNEQPDIAVFRFNADGSVDNGFGANGMFYKVTTSLADVATNLVIDPATGNILISGQQEVIGDPTSSWFFVMRLLPSGSPDPSFGSAGMFTIKANSVAMAVDLALQEDGKVVVSGTQYCGGLCTDYGFTDIFLFRLQSNGTLDLAFGRNGKLSVALKPFVAYSSNSVEFGGSLASQGTNLIVGGMASYMNNAKVLVVRLKNSSPLIGATPITPITYTTIPAKIEAEAYYNQSGTQLENTSDAGGGQNVGWIDQGDWLDYNISAPSAGTYTVNFRVATTMDGAQFGVYNQQGQLLTTISIPNTGGWQNWSMVSATVTLPAGNQSLRLYSSSAANWNINWFEFTQGTTPPVTYVTIPAKIEAENYSAQSGTQVENTTDAGGGQNVGYIEQGDWMEYNIAAPSAGTYTLNIRVASQMSGGSVEVRSSTGTVLASFTVPNTGGWQNWTTLPESVTLPAGNQTIRLVSTSSASWNINWLEFLTAAPAVTYVSIPAKIEAEAYADMTGVQKEATQDAGGGLNVGWIDKGDWMDYNIAVPVGGTFSMQFRVASPMDNGRIWVYSNKGDLLASVAVPNTGGWQNWTTVNAVINLPQGPQSIRIFSGGDANWNLNWFAINQDGISPVDRYTTIPSKIEAEDYVKGNGVQSEPTTDAGGGLNLGWIDQWDYWDYNIAVPAAGTYTLSVRVASPMSGGRFEVRSEDGTILTTFDVPNTGGWQAWVTLSSSVTLPARNQTIRLLSTASANWNLNWLEFVLPSATTKTSGTQEGGETRITPVLNTLSAYPNPVRSSLTLQVNNDNTGVLQVDVLDLSGRMQKRFSVNKQGTSTTTTLPLSGLPTGVYILRVKMDGWTETRKIIKE